jgi:hypothetical protein
MRYVVDLATEKAGAEESTHTPAKQPVACAKNRAARKQLDLAAYNRLVERFNEQRARTELDKHLAHAIQWIEDSTKWGASRASWIVASPDGAYLVFSAHNEPLLLIEIETLATRLLAAAPVGSNLPTPVAWAPDSRQLAYAPPNTDQVHIYSTAQHAVVASKTGAGPWVLALSWSPQGQRLAAFGLVNRRMNKSPLGLLGAAAGHPEFRNDGALNVYTLGDQKHFSVLLKRGISEWGSPNIELEWN